MFTLTVYYVLGLPTDCLDNFYTYMYFTSM